MLYLVPSRSGGAAVASLQGYRTVYFHNLPNLISKISDQKFASIRGGGSGVRHLSLVTYGGLKVGVPSKTPRL